MRLVNHGYADDTSRAHGRVAQEAKREVGPAGIEPTTSTVESGRFTDLGEYRDRKRKQEYPAIGELGA
jgi:hypothetical protein